MHPSQAADKFVLRLPDGMRQSIRQRAAANRRSMNAEIVFHLDRVLMADENESPAAAATAPGMGSTFTRQEKTNGQHQD